MNIEDEERAHLAHVLNCLQAATARADGLAQRAADSHREAGAYLAGARGELSPEEAHLSAYELNRMDQQAASAALARQRLHRLLGNPYFARVDFCENGSTSQTYIGRSAFTWENRSLISDWRSPVAALFYDFEPGPASFATPAAAARGSLPSNARYPSNAGSWRGPPTAAPACATKCWPAPSPAPPTPACTTS